MTSGDGSGGPVEGHPTRRRLLGAVGGLALLGLGPSSEDRRSPAGESERGSPGARDVVAFCGSDAVCASVGGTVVLADRRAGGWSFRRHPTVEGFSHIAETGVVVAVEVGERRFRNPNPAVAAAVAAYDRRVDRRSTAPSHSDGGSGRHSVGL